MYIDHSKLPDPANPQADDVFVTFDGRRTIVVADASPNEADMPPSAWTTCFIDGLPITFPRHQMSAALVSIGARPWGRLDRSSAAHPTLTQDREQVEQRLSALGPHLRAIREQYGLSMGDLARALGCPPARLSMLELGEPDPVREGAGVREDEGRAALAELLTETVARALGYALGEDDGLSGIDHERVWEAIHAMLITNPAHAAMSTILKARGEAETAANPGTSAMDLSNLNPETAAARVVAMLVNDGLLLDCTEDGLREKLLKALVNTLGRLKPAEVKLANNNVATETSRASLAHLLTVALCTLGPMGEEPRDDDEQAEIQETLAEALSTDEAQRLIRLHG